MNALYKSIATLVEALPPDCIRLAAKKLRSGTPSSDVHAVWGVQLARIGRSLRTSRRVPFSLDSRMLRLPLLLSRRQRLRNPFTRVIPLTFSGRDQRQRLFLFVAWSSRSVS